MEKNIEDIYCKFIELTKKLNLLDLNIGGVNIWQYSQFEIYNLILNKSKIFDMPHQKISKKKSLNSIPGILRNFILKSALCGEDKFDILVFNHPRKVLVNDKYIDIYTQFFIDEINKDNYCIMEKPYLGSHYPNLQESNIKYLDDMKVKTKISTYLKFVKLSTSERKLIKKIEEEIYASFEVSLPIEAIFKRNIKRFRANFNYYDKLIKKRSPKIIFLVVYYSYMELISAAKSNGIPVVEIQHGVITPFSINYNFPDNSANNLRYFPDKIMMFGDYWKKTVALPLDEKNLITTGFPFLENQIYKYGITKKRHNSILFISQGTIGRKLFNIALELSKKLPDYEVIFKLHPGEIQNWKYKYDYNDNNHHIKNFIIDYEGKKHMYEYFSEIECVVGVYSTAIYEAISFDCNLILVNLPGVEYMKTLYESGEIPIADNENDIYDFLNSKKASNNIEKEEFFKTEMYKTVLKDIIKQLD